MLDGAVILYGAPCGVGFVCSSDSCAPIALSRHVLVTGWYFRHRVCDGMVPMRNGRPDLQVVSWQELP